MHWGARVVTIATVAGVVIIANHVYQRPHPYISEFEWVPIANNNYHAQTIAKNDQLVCICGGYQCTDGSWRVFTDIEVTHLGYRGPQRTEFIVFFDPEKGDDRYGRHIRNSNICVEKQKGEAIEYALTEYVGLDSVGINEQKYLKLSIK